MPEVNPQGLDVSKEEQRFLHRAFRRFALPYMIALAGLGWIAATAGAPPPAGEQVEALVAEVAGLRHELAALEGRLEATRQQARAAQQSVAALESGDASDDVDPAALQSLDRKVGQALRRVAQLEKRPEAPDVNARIDALSDRVGLMERKLVAGTSRAAPPPAQADAPPVPAAPQP